MKYLVSILFVVFLLSACSDKESDNAKRGFNQQKLETFNASDQFDYDKKIDTSTNPILAFLGNILVWIGWLFGNYIGYIILIVLLVLLIWLIVKNYQPHSNRAEVAGSSIIVVTKEHISENDYEKLIKLALDQADYRLAMRFVFLNSLKMLQNAKLIDWHKEKTNYQYVSELPEVYKREFVQIVTMYEWVWYGQFEADLKLYQSMNSLNNGFIDQIKKLK